MPTLYNVAAQAAQMVSSTFEYILSLTDSISPELEILRKKPPEGCSLSDVEDLIIKKQDIIKQMIKNKSDGDILDLSHTYLAGLDLSKMDLSRVNLEKANLTGANLREMDLTGANLTGANLERARLVRAILEWADLTNANLFEAILLDASLNGAILKNANLERTFVEGAHMSTVDTDSVDMNGVRTLISRPSKERSNLSGENLSGVDKWCIRHQFKGEFGPKFTNRLASCPTEKRLNLSGMGCRLENFVIYNYPEEKIIKQSNAINLSNNRLTKIPDFILKNKERIIELDLSNNAFTEFPNLSGFTKLKTLIFENNNPLLFHISPYRLPPFINSIEFNTQQLALVKDTFVRECEEAGLEINEIFDKLGLITFKPNEHIKAKG
ncbi:putative low-complexity protein [Candidatus Regiella insecticola 5.15]|uniref:Putative low-complexity protein n=1 Tax=Candidatus Regiella insecticola 5.15 TaxID=1005043 RepID=G2GXR4_9ENTR|nr:pentapeptide repeat-containing protein [Candidatus Regiella insecticola]EGY29471.1 putative low-complexity protein [Candidatus Regiella insecticola 5.15]